MSATPQLLLHALRLPPGIEWPVPQQGWVLVFVTGGDGLVLGRGNTQPFAAGDLVVAAGGLELELKAGRVGGLRAEWFHFDTASLFGVLTLPERRRLEAPARFEPPLPWVLRADSDAARAFSRAVGSRGGAALERRSRLLEVVSAALLRGIGGDAAPGRRLPDAGDRLQELLHQMTDSEILSLTSDQLAELCRCEKRRLLLVFRERFGETLPGQQEEWRRVRACSLLAQPGASVAEVARACGYEDPDAFRAWFRRQFGVAPAHWRQAVHDEIPVTTSAAATSVGPPSSPERHADDKRP